MVVNYDKDALNEICKRIDLLEYASQSMDFQKKGADSYATHCPRHVDKTASLFITPSKNKFHCFSCGCGGDIISWIMTFENCTFNEAVGKIGELTETDIKNIKQCNALKIYKSIQRMENIQNESEIQRTYLDESEINKFDDELPAEWIKEGIEPQVMKKFNIRIDKKSNRIIYPIYDSEYRLIGFKGRTRFQDYKTMGLQKYINYTKIGTTDFFVGMKENHDSIMDKNMIIIFEGIKSVMKAYGWGYDYAVAAETSCLSKEQVKLLIKSRVGNVIIAFDSDVQIPKIISSAKNLKRFTNVYIVSDRANIQKKLLGEKEAPVDRGREVFETLLSERVKI